ncbi:MAG: C40 family peptidase [Acidimicrobiales bacterium]
MFSTTRPASADQISDAKAEAAAITAKLQAIQGQEQTLSGQVQAADFQLSQLQGEIAANQAEVIKDQAEVDKDQAQLRVQAISDYTSSGTTNQVTQMFSSNVDVSDIRSEYSSIAAGNVTTTIDQLHTAQSKLQATQAALQQQTSQATVTRNGLQSSESQAASLASQYQGTLNSVNANIQKLVAEQQAAEAAAAQAAATAAFNAKVAAAQKAQAQAAEQTSANTGGGSNGSGSGSGGGGGGGPATVAAAAPPVAGGAGGAVQAAESQLGVPYVWGGETPGVGFDCSGLVQWSYAQAGIGLPRTSGAQYEATVHIPLADIEPGDLLFYGPDGSEHVAMYVGGGSMIEAPYTGATVHITGVRTGSDFAGVGRVG